MSTPQRSELQVGQPDAHKRVRTRQLTVQKYSVHWECELGYP